jgi:hypothetical protein
MKIQFAVAVGILLTLGTAVATTLKSDGAATQVRSVGFITSTTASSDVLAMLEAQANTSGSIPLARAL